MDQASLTLCPRNSFYEGKKREGNKNYTCSRNFFSKKRKGNRRKIVLSFPPKLSFQNVGGKGRKERENKLKLIKEITKIIKITILPNLSL